MVTFGDAFVTTREQERDFRLRYLELEDEKNKASAIISVDNDNEPIIMAFSQYGKSYDEFVAAYLTAIAQESPQFRDKFAGKVHDAKERAKPALMDLTEAIQLELGRVLS